jgi:hypothetical protein
VQNRNATPMDGGFTAIVLGLMLLVLLSVLRVSGVETNIRPLDNGLRFVLNTIGIDVG